MRRQAPAAIRNRDPIAGVLERWLPASGTMLEIASGSGEHALHFSARFPHLRWQPSDPDAAARASINAWREEGGENLLPALALDTAAQFWPVARADGIVCINMVHISPWEATCGLFAGAERLLPPGAPLILYGPFFEEGPAAAPSNLAFDRNLRARDRAWGLRAVEAIAALSPRLPLVETVAMPANNLMLLFRRIA